MHATISTVTVLDLVPFGLAEGKNSFFALRLSHPGWQTWQPGQFVMIRPDSFNMDLVWGRPFCICHMTQSHLVCFFKIVGKGTRRLAALHKGDQVTVWGPLGNGFAYELDRPTLLLAGGMGIAPFIGYVHHHPQPWNMSMLFGHREPAGCYPLDSINEHIPVDSLREYDPSDLDNFIYSMQEKIADCAEQKGLILACGPEPFLKTARSFALQFGARLQLSLEPRMACGVGACLGCVCKTTDKWPHAKGKNMPVQTCLHGPVFWADQVEL